jgi:hypothetical protein
MNDVRITKRVGGLGRRFPSADMVCGLIMHGLATTDYTLGDIVTLFTPQDARDIGLDEAYDTNNSVLVFYHIKEFFRMNPNGELWLMLVDQNVTTWSDMVDITQTAYAKALLVEANGRIRVLGVAFNPDSSYNSTLSGGLDDQIVSVITKAQELAEEEYLQHRPLDVVIEGKEFNGTAGSATDLRTLDAENCSVVIAQDPDIAALDPLYAHHAALGTILGTISGAKVNENIGWVERFRVTGAGNHLKGGLSSNLRLNVYSESAQNQLNTKGYIFLRQHTGISGLYWNDSHTCTLITSDYAYIENNRTIHKGARLIREFFLPRLNSPIAVSDEGQLDKIVIDSFETLGRTALLGMSRNEEISQPADVYVDPEQNILSTSKLEVRFSLIPYGTARNIEASIGFENPSA